MPGLGIGIDFGTSNSSAAALGEEGAPLRVALEPRFPPTEVMPTALYLDRRLRSAVGTEAIERYVADNAGRTVVLRREAVGEIVITVAGTDQTPGDADGGAIQDPVQVHAFTDRELPGRLFRSVKRWLGHQGVESVRVFDRRFRLVALATPILTRLREAAERELGRRPESVHVGRPVHYDGRGGDPDAVALRRMAEACRHAGLPRPVFFPEPVAAALSWLGGRDDAAAERNVLAFDFGGGTLDLSLVRVRGERFSILATAGRAVGGDTVDRMLYRACVFPELGEGAPVRRPMGDRLVERPFPFREFADRLLNWQLAYELNRPDLLELLAQGARERGEAGRRIDRLRALVSGNLSYAVFRAIEEAKLELSEKERSAIRVPELDLDVSVERRRLEALLEPVLDDVHACLDELLEAAEMGPEAVDVVVRTGGSSRIPAVIRLLEERFPGRVVEHDLFTGIAAGLSVASRRALPAPPTRRLATASPPPA